MRLIEDWKAAADRKDCLIVLSMDKSKAFDSLHPASMIQKLKAYGFSEESVVILMRSFLGPRKNRIKLPNLQSVWKEQTRGCPQGSSFGPLLWNLFQIDLHHMHRVREPLHQMYTIGDSIENAAQELKKETERITQWYNRKPLKGQSQQILDYRHRPEVFKKS